MGQAVGQPARLGKFQTRTAEAAYARSLFDGNRPRRLDEQSADQVFIQRLAEAGRHDRQIDALAGQTLGCPEGCMGRRTVSQQCARAAGAQHMAAT